MAIYGIKDCANLTLFDKITGQPVIYTDYANVSTNDWTSERVYATAKGTNAIAWDYNRQATLEVEMEVFDLSWLAILAGTEIVEGATEIARREVATLRDGEATIELKGAVVEGSVKVVEISTSDLVSQVAVLEAGNEDFEVEGSTVTISENFAGANRSFAVYYLTTQATAKTITIPADKFPKAFSIVADALIREKETGADEFVQITFDNARPLSNFTITMSATEATTISATFDLFPNKQKEIAVYTIIEDLED